MKVHTCKYANGAWQGELPTIETSEVLAIAFGGPEYFENHAPFEELQAKYPGATLFGCSTSGEILDSEISDESVVIALLEFEKSKFKMATAAVRDFENSTLVGESLARELKADGLKAVSVISDGLSVNGTELANGLNSTLADDVVVSGGLAADGEDFNRTWILIDGKPTTGFVSAVGFYGSNLEVSFGSEGGWQPFGPEREITKSENNVLYELDGRPALELYKEYLGDRASGLPSTALLFPLQVRTTGRPLVRTILSIDEANQSMTFAGDVPEGSVAQLMRATQDSLVEGAETAAQQTNKSTQESICIAVSCVGRRLVLGESSEEEIEATKEAIGEATTQIGFYSYGELAPTGFAPCGLHNQTMTLTTISES